MGISSQEGKISLLITTANLDHGGVEEVILEYGKQLDKTCYRVTVGCLVHGRVAREIEAVPGVMLVHIASTSRLLRLWHFVMLARSVRADIVHNHACWYGLIAGFLTGARRIETIHNIFVWFTPLQRLLYGLYALLAQKIIAVSDHVREYSISEIPFMRAGRITVIRNGINASKFHTPRGDIVLRRELGIAPDAVVAGFIGRLVEQKGVGFLLDAAAEPIVRSMKVVLIIVGEGELRADLERKASELGIADIKFTGYRRDIPRFLSMFDIFVLPSLWEGLPVSVLEASASGCPVVATRVSGTPEVVVDGVTGFLVEPKNAHDLAERISLLAADASLRMRMGMAGAAHVKEYFSAGRMIRETEALYHEVRAE